MFFRIYILTTVIVFRLSSLKALRSSPFALKRLCKGVGVVLHGMGEMRTGMMVGLHVGLKEESQVLRVSVYVLVCNT